jgi:hypothetical protein
MRTTPRHYCDWDKGYGRFVDFFRVHDIYTLHPQRMTRRQLAARRPYGTAIGLCACGPQLLHVVRQRSKASTPSTHITI